MDRAMVETRVLRVLRWVVIAVLVIVTLFPFFYMLLLSVRPIDELLQNPGRIWAGPAEWTTKTYKEVLTSTATGGQGFLKFLTNSAIVSISATLLTLLVSIPGAYAVSRLKFVGRRQVPAEAAQGLQRLVPAAVAGDAEGARVRRHLDLDLVALLEAEGLDHGGGQAHRQAVAPSAHLHRASVRISSRRSLSSPAASARAVPSGQRGIPCSSSYVLPRLRHLGTFRSVPPFQIMMATRFPATIMCAAV